MYMANIGKKNIFDALNKVQEACKTAGEDNLADVSLRWLKHHSLLEKEVGDGVIIGAEFHDALSRKSQGMR